MASVPIGGVRVDLQLNSAAFIRDIAKSNAAVASNTKTMMTNLNRLGATASNVGKTFGAWLTFRAAKRVISFLDQSIELAAKLDTQLGETARAFEMQGAAMKNAFKLGAAQGFLSVMSKGATNSQAQLARLAQAGLIIGKILGALAVVTVDVFTVVIPKAINFTIAKINDLITAANKAIEIGEMIDNALGLNKDYGRIPLIPVVDVQAGISAFFDLSEAEKLAAEASGLVAAGQEKAATAIKKTTEAAKAQTLVAGLLTQQQYANAKSYVDAAAQVTSTLNQAFEGNKAIQIANALVNAAAAMVQALNLPFPLNWAQVAAVGALAATQIAAIRSAKPGSGGNVKGGTSKGNSGVKSAGSASNASRDRGAFTQAVTIEILGDVFGPEHFRKIVAGLNDVQRDGTALLRMA